MTMEKLTYVNAINFAIKAMQGDIPSEESDRMAVIEKLVALGQSLEKRNAKSDKPTKKQVENGNVKAEILKVLTAEGQKCGDIAEKVGISGQKASALLRQLIDTEQVEKYEDKRVTYFKLKG